MGMQSPLSILQTSNNQPTLMVNICCQFDKCISNYCFKLKIISNYKKHRYQFNNFFEHAYD